jgi:hypothetical protein
MRCHPALTHVVLPSLCVVALAGATGACAGSTSQVASAASADALIGLQLTNSTVTLDNRTGTSIVSGQLQLVSAGTRPPFFVMLPRLQSGEKRDFALDSFRTNDGTPFRRSLARARAVKVTATDLSGKTHEYEIPFD